MNRLLSGLALTWIVAGTANAASIAHHPISDTGLCFINSYCDGSGSYLKGNYMSCFRFLHSRGIAFGSWRQTGPHICRALDLHNIQ